MTSSPATTTPRELVVRTPDGKSRTIILDTEAVPLGRAATNTLCYPDDAGLSRQHMVIEKSANDWVVRDLNSKNGTIVNGNRISAPYTLRLGDRISAGHLTIEFVESGKNAVPAANTVVFVDSAVVPTATTTVATSLEGLMGPEQEDTSKTRVFTGQPQTRALIRAGRELAGHRPLSELFEVIMDLSLEAVSAGRGILMALEGDQLVVPRCADKASRSAPPSVTA